MSVRYPYPVTKPNEFHAVLRGSANLDSVMFVGAGLVTLLIGSWTPDPRLDFSGIPVGLILLIAMSLLIVARPIGSRILSNSLIVQFPLLLSGITLIWSDDVAMGTDKLATLLISGNIAFILFAVTIERIGLVAFSRILVFFLTTLLIVAVVYKLRLGFFKRDVLYFLNGPIVFARLMSIAAVLSMFVFKKWLRILTVCGFFLAIVWTQSKGPLTAVVVSLVAYGFFQVPKGKRWLTVLWMSGGLAVMVIIVLSLGIDGSSIGRLGILYVLLSGDFDAISEGQNLSSLGVRFGMWTHSWELIQSQPFGVGLGGWAANVDFSGAQDYPHNLVLEFWSEAGIIIGSLACLPMMLFLVFRKNVLSFVALCLLMAQMVSGDLGDARFLLVFSLLACFCVDSKAFGSWHGVRPGS